VLLTAGAAPILFVGGKGGVGKTTVAAALGVQLADAGGRVLVVSTDPAHSLGDIFDAAIGDRETALLPRLYGIEIDAEQEATRYLERVAANMRTFVQPSMYAEIERQVDLARHSPGAAEAALLDRVADLLDEARARYDHVIFDTAPTGHTLRLLALPELMAAWTDGLLRSRERSSALGRALGRLGGKPSRAGTDQGIPDAGGDDLSLIDRNAVRPADARAARIREVLLERRRRFSRARRLLLDPAMTAFLLVLVPEKLPILETAKALHVLRGHRIPVTGLVVNRVLPAHATGAFVAARREQEAGYLQRIDRDFGALPRMRVPLLDRDVAGLDGLREVGRHLAG
jgi:arsenite/tail-anchored protein-transporting ATPase